MATIIGKLLSGDLKGAGQDTVKWVGDVNKGWQEKHAANEQSVIDYAATHKDTEDTGPVLVTDFLSFASMGRTDIAQRVSQKISEGVASGTIATGTTDSNYNNPIVSGKSQSQSISSNISILTPVIFFVTVLAIIFIVRKK